MRFTAYPLNKIEISENRIRENMQLLLQVNKDIAIAPVLKSNAYGHGIELIGKLLEEYKVPFYCVNSIQEAHQLREAGVTTDILIMGYVDPSDLASKEWDYIFVILDIAYARIVNKYQHKARVHLHIETGLHREGIDILSFPELLTEIKNLENLHVEGIMSHLACSNDPACPTTVQQLSNFTRAKKLVEEFGFSPKWVHLGGSLALLNKLATGCNVVRVGKAIFGIALNTTYSGGKNAVKQDDRMKEFNLVLTLKTKIAQIKYIKKGDHLGYADLFIAELDMTIGILPIGYNDGVDRRLSNKGKMIVGGVACPILGVVAMNVTTIDLSDVENPQVGQDVIVYSQEKSDGNSLDNAAIVCGTLPQDLLLHLPVNMVRELH